MSRKIILAGTWFLLAQDLMAVDLIAHRGYTCRAEDNTIEAVADAWRAAADGVEIDIRVSGDGVVFAYHDESIAGRTISDMDYAEISEIAREAAPTLKSILLHAPPRGFLVLDLKESDWEKYGTLSELITEAGIHPDRLVVQSGSVEALTAAREALPGASFYFLSDLKRRFPLFRAPEPQSILAKIDGTDLDGVSLKGRRFIDMRFVQRIQEAGYRVSVWTINDPKRMTHYRDIGIDGLITDELESARSWLRAGRDPATPCFERADTAGGHL